MRMKQYYPLNISALSVFIFFVLFPLFFNAQERYNKLNVNVQSAFLDAKGSYQDAWFSAINPGAEILYERKLFKNISFLTGAGYLHRTWNYSMGPVSFFRQIANEIYIPVLLTTGRFKRINLTLGIYPGWLVKGKELYSDKGFHSHWHDITKYYDDVSNQKFSSDLFLGAGYIQPVSTKLSVQIEPFIKYRFTDNWMGEVRNRVSYGVKLSCAWSFGQLFKISKSKET